MLRNFEGHELPSYKISFMPGEKMEVNTCALIVDNFEVSSRNEEVNACRIQATRQVSTFRRKKKKRKSRFSGSSEAIVFGSVLSPGKRKSLSTATVLCKARSEHPQDGSGYYFWPSYVSLRYDDTIQSYIEHQDQACQRHHIGPRRPKQRVGSVTLYVFQWV